MAGASRWLLEFDNMAIGRFFKQGSPFLSVHSYRTIQDVMLVLTLFFLMKEELRDKGSGKKRSQRTFSNFSEG